MSNTTITDLPTSSSFDSSSWITLSCLAFATVFYALKWFDGVKYKNIPTVGGPSLPILSYLGALRFFKHGEEMIKEGYDKYRGGAFRVANHNRWHIVVTGPQLIEELKKAPDDVLSFNAAIVEGLHIRYTIGPSVAENGYHIPIIRTTLTRNLGSLFPDIREELAESCKAVLPDTDEWTKVHALPAVMKIIARTSSRVFVGLPLCRNDDFNNINIGFAIDVVVGAITLNLFPAILHPIAAIMFTNVPKTVRRTQAYLEPIIKERYRCMEAYGENWADKPNDMLQWLMEVAVGEEKSPRHLTLRILTVSFAAIHTSSMSFTYALFRLAAFPEYLHPLREEIEQIVAEEGWTKQSLQRMRKVDSFLKECQRVDGLGSLSMTRKALSSHTFSDGTHIPRGSFVSAASLATHTDAENYGADADTFNPWRFAEMRDDEGEGMKHQMVNLSTEYVPFGLGRHACPGRFFAANELKALLAHLVMHYDVRMEHPGVVPPPIRWAATKSPNREASVMFRRRQTVAKV